VGTDGPHKEDEDKVRAIKVQRVIVYNMNRHISFTIYGAAVLSASKDQPIQRKESKTVFCNLLTEQLTLNTDKNLLNPLWPSVTFR
jgi:hypothetical protein